MFAYDAACIYLVHVLSRVSAEVLQCEVTNNLTIVPAAHIHNQEPVLFKSIDLMQCEHGCCPVLHFTLLLHQSAKYSQNREDFKSLGKPEGVCQFLPLRTRAVVGRAVMWL